MKNVIGIYDNTNMHWVGNGFPVRSLFSYRNLGESASPFLLLDYCGPEEFAPTSEQRGVEQHPHRGFETVTIVYEGEIEHRDSTGHGGVIGPGDVQWMTAGSGILHEEYHSSNFAKTGGVVQSVQLWVNLPAKDKMVQPAYQGITANEIPNVDLPGGAGNARVIAGELLGTKGPARTFTPINAWDVRLNRNSDISLPVPQGHTTVLVVLTGNVTVNAGATVGEAQVMLLGREGETCLIHADDPATILVLTGEPLREPIVGYGPFVMNSEAEIQKAISDLKSGRFVSATESVNA